MLDPVDRPSSCVPVQKMQNFQDFLSPGTVKKTFFPAGITLVRREEIQDMEPTFFIELNMKTHNGFECYGRFDLGNNREFALSLLSKLEGRPPEGDSDVLHMDLVEKYSGLPMNVYVVSCSV